MGDEQAAKTADFLTAGYLTHDTPITLAAARMRGLNAVAGVPDKVYELFEICTFGKCARPTVALYR